MPSEKDRPSPIGIVRRGHDPKVTLRIIGRCNFRCPSCSSFSGPERKGRLSMPDFRRILDVLDENGFRGVINLSGGETTLHPDLPAMVSLASRRFRRSPVVVFTNGDWVGRNGWKRRLKSLLSGPNVLLRFSLDRQHAEGKARARFGRARPAVVAALEKERLDAARAFMSACRAFKAKPGRNFDFAFKGTLPQAERYTARLGAAPLYPIAFQRDPLKRPRRPGFLAVDLDDAGRPVVYRTLGHVSGKEALGGVEALPAALAWNREALRRRSRSGA